jgi:MFS family permease
MRTTIDLIRSEPRARSFFALLTQSSLGTGAAYVALLLIAYDRFRSPWAISLVLIAELLPPMALGPVFGAAADRWSRRSCAVLADVIRAAAFAGIAVVDGFGATLALAFVSGIGTALFTPATLAALPSLVQRKNLSAATSLYGAITDFGLAIGPALAAVALIAIDAEEILVINAITFAVSALLLARLDFGKRPELDAEAVAAQQRLLAEAREGLRVANRIPGLAAVLGASAAGLFFGGLVNVAELPFVTGELNGSDVAFSVAVALAGVGVATGSLAGGAGGDLSLLKRRYVGGLAVMGIGFFLTGLAPGVEIVFATFLLAGFGNGVMLVHERLIVQATVPDRYSARIFGIKDALSAWAFATSFLAAGALVDIFETRPVLLVAGAGVVLVAAAAAIRVRDIEPTLAHPDGAVLHAPIDR